jgi:hypothetical protein
MGKLIDLTGQKFNHLEVLRKDDSRHENCACWVCKCDVCGCEVSMKANALKSLRYQTCGCGHPMNDVQGQSRDRLYGIWIKMKHRCYNAKTKHYKNYGARGITICDEWLNDYNVFRDWALSNGYKDTLTIDRIDFDGNYEPSNCRWTTLQEQNRNTSRTVKITVNGITKCKEDWSRFIDGKGTRKTTTVLMKIRKWLGDDVTICVQKGNEKYVF